MPLSREEKSQFEKDLNNSERFILEKLSKDRKVSYIRHEQNKRFQKDLLDEIRTLNVNVTDHMRVTKWTAFPFKYTKFTVFLALGFLVSLSSPIYLVLKYREEIKSIIETFGL